jgi:hypothetical protein
MLPNIFFLFLPGTGASPDFWKPVGSRLPPGWTKHYFGWPGLGAEPPDPAFDRREPAGRIHRLPDSADLGLME